MKPALPAITLILVLAVLGPAGADQGFLFDMKLDGDRRASAEAFRGVLPARFLQTGQGAEIEEIAKAHGIPLPPNPKGYTRTELGHRIAGDYAFTNLLHTFGRVGPPGARGDYVLTQIKFWGGEPMPSRGRVERGLAAVVGALGQPDAIYHYTRGLGENRRVTNTKLKFRWLRSGARLDYQVERQGLPFWFELEYTTPQALPGIAGRFNEKSWLEADDADPMDELKTFLDRIPRLPAGDGGFAILEPDKTLAGRLSQFTEVISRRGDVIWDKQYRDLAAKLDRALQADFKRFATKDELYSHLLSICQNGLPGSSSGAIQCGAAAYLASFDDPAALDYLFAAGEIDLPEGVKIHAHEGIGRLCSGEVMDRVLAMLDTADSDAAYYILLSLDTREKLAELKQKLPRTVTSERGKRAGYGAVNNLPSMIENHEAIRAREAAAAGQEDR